MRRSNQIGATMLESLAVLAITGVLAVAAMKLVNGLFDLFRQNMVVSEIRELQKNITSRYALEGDYKALATVTAKQLVDEKVIPTQIILGKGSDTPSFRHSLGGDITIQPSAMADYYYEITFNNLTNRGCLNLSQVNWTTSQNSALIQLEVNGFKFVLPVGGKGPNDDDTLPVSVAKAAKRCAGSKNTIIWTFL